jgi:hemoglobin
MTDIRDKKDVALLIDLFYQKAVPDAVIGHFFTTVVQVSWAIHIPIIISFWDGILFGDSGYKGNIIIKHIELNRLSNLKPEHFNRWLQLWAQIINENFIGPKANEAISRANSIAAIMQLKINTA